MPGMTTTAFEQGARNAAHDLVIAVDSLAARRAPTTTKKKGVPHAALHVVDALAGARRKLRRDASVHERCNERGATDADVPLLIDS
jgi:hypothetical protein